MNVLNHKFPFLISGEFITLRKMILGDAELIYKWRTSKVAKYLNRPENYTIESQIQWMNNRTDKEANYIIVRNDLHEKIGMVAILDINWNDKVGSVGRLLLDEQYVKRSQPYGLEALMLTYQYVFEIIKMRKITGIINTKNKKVYELQKYLGMFEEGILKRHVILNGREDDLYILSLFQEDFVNYKAKIDEILNRFR